MRTLILGADGYKETRLLKREPLLEIRDLRVSFKTGGSVVSAVDGVSLHVNDDEIIAIVGESGCGKSVTLLSILRLIQTPPGHIDAGQILLKGCNLLKLSEREMREIRGNEIAMIFQEPMSSLNPVFTVGDQISEAITLHQKVDRREALSRVVEMLRLVGIPDPEKRRQDYPHQMSGGMRQRVMIAMALSCNPKLLLADEPTTALDVSVEAQILDLIRRLQKELGMAIILVTHNLGVVAGIAQRVLVMYAGKIVEEGDVFSIFSSPLHPYTEGLLKCAPRLDRDVERLYVIEGSVPDPVSFPKGCRFHPRCAYAVDDCRETVPVLRQVAPSRFVACHVAEKHARAD
jgi:oligopeptide/dipeptide ABC transporter ATP-binding protein